MFTWLDRHPLTDSDDVNYVKEKYKGSKMKRNLKGMLSNLHLLHAMVDDDEVKRAF